MTYPRDMVGYGAEPPAANWPGRARVALQFVINYEEGGENNILHGDSASEAFLSEIVGAQAFAKTRHFNMESIYEYGSRAGFWRLHRLFTERDIPVTVFAVAMAMERNPKAVEAMLKADWEIASHGYRWIDYQFAPAQLELEHLQRAVEIHRRTTGSTPAGMYLGRTSPNTHRITAEYGGEHGGEHGSAHGGFVYSADSYADDLPYWERQYAKPLLMVPYTLDANDMRFATPQGFNSGEQFFGYLKDAFDTLFAEGESRPKMMSVGLHPRLVGRPGRAAALTRFLDYVLGHSQVWLARRVDIANHWRERFPVEAQ